MKAGTLLEKVNEQRESGEKELILKGLAALMQTYSFKQHRARLYLQNAYNYIEKN